MSTRRNRAALALAGLGVVATCVLAAGIGPASADPDPTSPGTPAAGTDSTLIAGVGADADAELVDAIAADYNATSPTASLESFDAVNPTNGNVGETISTKPGCSLTRPNGTGAGSTALLNTGLKASASSGGDGTSLCTDFARFSSGKASNGSQNNLDLYALTTDAVTWVTVTGSYGPPNLTLAQLKAIFECTDTDWSQVGGQAGPIHVYVPPTTAATYTFFLQQIGSSVADVASGCGTNGTIAAQQNDGTTIKGDPQGIAPYAIGKWAAQSNVEKDSSILVRDVRGGTVLGSATVNATDPVVSPTTTNGNYLTVNTGFTPKLTRTLYDATLNTNYPSYFTPTDAANIFGTNGFVCTSATVQQTFAKYGFAPLSASACGQKS